MADEDIHVYPINDLQEHILEGLDCPCEPTIEVVGAVLVIAHNAWDNREIIEQAEEIINYLEKRCEISSEFAKNLRNQLKTKGVRSFGMKKEDEYYLKQEGF